MMYCYYNLGRIYYLYKTTKRMDIWYKINIEGF